MPTTDSITAFHRRIEPDEAQSILAAVRRAGYLEDANSVIVHDLDRMQSRIKLLQTAFPTNTIHAIAIKANPLVEILRRCVQCGCGLEAASIEEVQLAIAADCPSENIIFDSPAKTESEIRQALRLGIHLNADNLIELSRIDSALQSESSRSTIGLRINPEVSAGTISTTNVGSLGSKFGVSITADRDAIIAAFDRYRWLVGLHVHIGSQGCSLDLLCDGAQRVQTLREEIEATVKRRISTMDIGGGLPAVYRSSDHSPSPQEYADRLTDQIPDLMQNRGKLITEFGRAVQAGCGIAFSRVEYVRSIGDRAIAVIHLGADFLLRPVYRPHDWRHEFLVFDRNGQPKSGPTEPITIAGPLCFGGDFVSDQIELPQVEPGDWIAIRDCGAYTLGMWSRHCSRGIPTVVGVDQGKIELLRPAESPTDIAEYWSR